MNINMEKATFVNQTTIHNTTIWMPAMPSADAAEKIKIIVDDVVKNSKDLIDALQCLVTRGFGIEFNPYNNTYSLYPNIGTLAKKQCDELAAEKLTEWERFRLTESEKKAFDEYAYNVGKSKSQILREFIQTIVVENN